MLDPAAQYSSAPLAQQVSYCEGGFWARLFDLSFTSFVTPMIIRAIYIIGLVIAFAVEVIAVFVSWSSPRSCASGSK